MSAGTQTRQALLAGEKLTTADVQKRFKGRNSTLHNVTQQLRKKGHQIAQERVNGKMTYWLTPINGHDATPEERADQPVILPELGESLQVALLAVDRKGVLGMTLRNDKYSWRVIIEGQAAKG